MGQSASKKVPPTQVEENAAAAANQTTVQTTDDDTTATATPKRQPDRLRDGPCSDVYSDLEKCASKKGVKEHAQKLQACPDQTDRLIKCMNKNPAYFLEK